MTWWAAWWRRRSRLSTSSPRRPTSTSSDPSNPNWISCVDAPRRLSCRYWVQHHNVWCIDKRYQSETIKVINKEPTKHVDVVEEEKFDDINYFGTGYYDRTIDFDLDEDYEDEEWSSSHYYYFKSKSAQALSNSTQAFTGALQVGYPHRTTIVFSDYLLRWLVLGRDAIILQSSISI